MSEMITLKQNEIRFLERFQQEGFKLVDMNLIETLEWTRLSHDDLKQMDERSLWQDRNQVYALRNDFTDQCMRYYARYTREATKIAYSGPIVRHHQVETQLGIERYDPNEQDIFHCLETFLSYIHHDLSDYVSHIIIGHYKLFGLLLEEKDQKNVIYQLIEQRNISELKAKLGIAHPVVQLLLKPTTSQLDYLATLFDPDHEIIQSLKEFETWFKAQGIEDVHLDITPMAPRSYYTGVFMHCHLEKAQDRQLSGGYYKGALEGFGLGLTL
ncbi:ATP phosphoribosyltransferase regulatory subunit [Staphylococcus massiliensis]|uniref:ATP phosphoribosyltransferase regulatory subunit n=1 Tax=Staphylococcus massiliensis TaxID=555791 RepID=UPI001EDFA81C|nr:ATP phosphoribosyltransferase regulatory subunit [Staphylococcus massiliensis]MCG3412555.1 ATP phosphoribosyltransferase regulatory subunit [Staphylococcus massiliensis]